MQAIIGLVKFNPKIVPDIGILTNNKIGKIMCIFLFIYIF